MFVMTQTYILNGCHLWWLDCVISSFRGEKTPRENTKKRHAKRRNNAMQKDEITPLYNIVYECVPRYEVEK